MCYAMIHTSLLKSVIFLGSKSGRERRRLFCACEESESEKWVDRIFSSLYSDAVWFWGSLADKSERKSCASDAETAKLRYLHFANESLQELYPSFSTFNLERHKTSASQNK